MADLMGYVEHLSVEIGPRPATTDAEERAAHYVRDIFEARGLEVETQAFDSPHTYSWAFVIYHLVTIVAALVSRSFPWAALALSAASAVALKLDLDTRWSLSSVLGRGPSQNVIARHVPRTGRNERVARVVLVAHYDSARSSLAFSPGMVKSFGTLMALTRYGTYAVPVLIAVRMLAGGFKFIEPWAWYLTLLPAVYLLIPLLINVHREILMHDSPGANDNASGVAALLGVFERLVPEPDAGASAAREMRRTRTAERPPAAEAPEDSILAFAPIAAPAPSMASWSDDDDIMWDTGVVSGQTSLGFEPAAPRATRGEAEDEGPIEPTDEQSMRLFGVPYRGPAAPRPAQPPAQTRRDASGLDEDTAPLELFDDEAPEAPKDRPAAADASSTRVAQPAEKHGLRDWLGIGGDFDARRKGREIGSWENFGDDDEDETGWKGGAASTDDPEDAAYTASVVARIRRKVTTNVDRDLVEKEVWFVATGAEEVGGAGMKAFLARYGVDLRDAAIINIDHVGAGSVSYVTHEGMGKSYPADRRLVSATRRAIREADLPVKGRDHRGLITDATTALARGYRAMSIMAFDINGRIPNWHWKTDTSDSVSEANIETAVELVTAVIREL